jgi:hypothetical protein
MTSISLFRLGFSLVLDENPITVYVSVDYDCPESTWPPMTRANRKLHRGHYTRPPRPYGAQLAAVLVIPTAAANRERPGGKISE